MTCQYMFAYGSNLCLSQMRVRCPAAKVIGSFTLPNARLVFRGVADCIPEPGAECPGGLWEITDACEEELDRYEGISSGLYYKDYFTVTTPEGVRKVLVYRMNSTGIFPPSASYFATIERGYKDFGLPLKALREARDAAWDDKHPSHVERRRHKAKGRPALAERGPVKKSKPVTAKAANAIRSLFDDEPQPQRKPAVRGAKSLKEWMDERYGRY